jgi:hypothetical protein
VREPRHETAARRRVLDEVNLAVVVLIDVRPIDHAPDGADEPEKSLAVRVGARMFRDGLEVPFIMEEPTALDPVGLQVRIGKGLRLVAPTPSAASLHTLVAR